MRNVALALATVLTVAPVAADDDEARTLSVSGRGELSVTPDLAVLAFAVETAAATAAAATEENARLSQAVSTALRERLEPDDRLTTSGYALEPRYRPRKNGGETPAIVGYVARNQVRVETGRIDNVGALIDAATGAGANRVSGLDFTVRERRTHLREALAIAGREARAQAESIAEALGVALGPVRHAAATPDYGPMPRQRAFAMTEARAATPIEAGDVTISATLNVTYELRDD